MKSLLGLETMTSLVIDTSNVTFLMQRGRRQLVPPYTTIRHRRLLRTTPVQPNHSPVRQEKTVHARTFTTSDSSTCWITRPNRRRMSRPVRAPATTSNATEASVTELPSANWGTASWASCTAA
jgi:hypothetical protein